MLKMISCNKFISYGKTRDPIIFHKGLNTILGGANANNSIGKSTMLLVIDFVFGGYEYLNSDAINHVGVHEIHFMFEFSKKYYFSRDTANKSTVYKTDENFNHLEEISVEDFRKFLKEQYNLDFYLGSFRDAVGRYFRIYGKENHNEKDPLKAAPNEPTKNAIKALEKLYDSFRTLEEYQKAIDDLKAKIKASEDAKKQDVISYGSIKNKKQYRENLKKLESLDEDLKIITESNNEDFIELNVNLADEISSIKLKLNNLLKDKVRIQSQIKLVLENLQTGKKRSNINSFEELEDFFPEVNLKKLEEIESFHNKITEILKKEYTEELARLESLRISYDSTISSLKNDLNKHGTPANIPTSYLQKFSSIERQKSMLENQNSDYLELLELKNQRKENENHLKDIETKELNNIESTINEQMVRFNDRIYERQRKAPVLKFKSNKSYEFYTPDDSGTGTNFKSLAIFDLSVLKTSALPAIAHDSLMFKNMGDEPINNLMKLYSEFDKQIFIAFDKDGAYSESTQSIINKSTVLKLDENGNELFGKSWNVKSEE